MPRLTWGIDVVAWGAFVGQCPAATFFHLPGWYAAWGEVGGFRPLPTLATWPDGREALLPLAVVPQFRGLVRGAYAGLGAAYGGVLAPTALTPDEEAAVYQAVRRRFPDLVVTGNPHGALLAAPPHGTLAYDETQVVPVLDRAAQRAAMGGSRRKALGQAQRAGLVLDVVEAPGPEAIARFYPLYEAHAARWTYERWRQDAGYFRALLTHAGPRLVLFRAMQDDRCVAFRLIARHAGRAFAVHLARDPASDALHAATWLVAESLAWLHAHGDVSCDFMPSGRLAGVREFKRSFGAASLPYVSASYAGALGRTLARVRRLVRPGAAA